jgi:hypothetical protein
MKGRKGDEGRVAVLLSTRARNVRWPVHSCWRRSRVNFSREIELNSLNQGKRMPMSAEP